MNAFIRGIRKVDTFLSKVETWLIVGVVAAMMLLTTAHVLLKVLGMGVIQLEEGARYLVIWVGFLGGAVAAYQSRHINIDILTRFIKGTAKRVVTSAVWLIAVFITAVLLKTAISYVGDLHASGDMAVSFGQAGKGFQVPVWMPAIIMPVGLGLIAWHMAAGALYAALGIPGPGHEQGQMAPKTSGGEGADDAASAEGGAA